MPEYLLPFEENTIFIAQTRQIQKRPFSLAVGVVIIPGVRNKTLKVKKHPEFSCLLPDFLILFFFITREINGKYEPA